MKKPPQNISAKKEIENEIKICKVKSEIKNRNQKSKLKKKIERATAKIPKATEK